MTNLPTVSTYLTELRDNLAESSDRCRAMRWFGALFRVGVAQDIFADLQAAWRRTTDRAYSALQYVLSATKKLHEAQAPESPGGVEITKDEAAPIFRDLNAAAKKLEGVS